MNVTSEFLQLNGILVMIGLIIWASYLTMKPKRIINKTIIKRVYSGIYQLKYKYNDGNTIKSAKLTMSIPNEELLQQSEGKVLSAVDYKPFFKKLKRALEYTSDIQGITSVYFCKPVEMVRPDFAFELPNLLEEETMNYFGKEAA